MVFKQATWRGFLPAACLFFAACLSPTLPVPPPGEPNALQEPLAQLLPDGRAIEVSGSDALPGSRITLWNEETLSGIVVRAGDQGEYHTVLPVDVSCVQPQNHIELWQTTMEGKNSEVKTYRLPNHVGNVPPPTSDAGCADAGGVEAGNDGAADAGSDVVTTEGGDVRSE